VPRFIDATVGVNRLPPVTWSVTADNLQRRQQFRDLLTDLARRA